MHNIAYHYVAKIAQVHFLHLQNISENVEKLHLFKAMCIGFQTQFVNTPHSM